ncbi:MAG: branched-chain amino acid transaminase [Acidobacteria bacterium]|nr:branched-chain amino acid transaminase [Acidobacteriota bacterium]
MSSNAPPAEKIWHNGQLIAWEDATVHVMSHTIHYGSSLFEGIRCYKTSRGPAVFRLDRHVERLFDSCKIYRMDVPFSEGEIGQAILDIVRANHLEECYIRPLVFRGYGTFGVNPLQAPVEVYVVVWKWGKYLGEEALEKGVDVCVSSWARMAPNTLPALAKASANYMNSQLIKMEAVKNGYVEGIALDAEGYVSEGSGENIFVVRHGRILTPPLGSSVLSGVTRDSVMTLAREQGIEVREEPIPRELLYIAEEVFFTGTAVEITPIHSIDRIEIGSGRRGPITAQLQEEFFAITQGEKEDRHGWLTPVLPRREKAVEETVK